MPYAIQMTGSLGSPADPVGHFSTVAEAQQALDGHAGGSYIVQVDGNGKRVVSVPPVTSVFQPPAPADQESE